MVLTQQRGKSAKVAAEVRRSINEGEYKPGQMLPTQKELCRRYNVASRTAWLAMERLAQDQLIVRVPGHGTFVNKASAVRTLDFVRVVRPANEPQNHTIVSYIDAFAELCAQRRYRAVWHHLLYASMDQPEETLKDFARSQGVIARAAPEPFLWGLHRMGVPVVSVWPRRQGTATPWPQIDYDRLVSARLVVEHLVSLGYRRIAYAAHGPLGWARGFIEVVQRHRLPVPVEWIIEGRDGRLADVIEKLQDIFTSKERPEAICCATDTDAATIERELLAIGLRVPVDVAIAACDSGPDAAAAPVPITRAGTDITEVCQRALDLIASVRPGFDPQASSLIEPLMIPVQLTVDRSTRGRSDR